jgi:hypothetical protein
MRRFAIMLALSWLCVGCASIKTAEDAVVGVGPQELVRDAVATVQSVINALNKSGTPLSNGVIEAEHWAPSIRKMNPKYVYSDGMNIAIVLHTSPREESGVYVEHSFTSSGFNAHQDDERNTWSGTMLTNGIYSFRREKTHNQKVDPIN